MNEPQPDMTGHYELRDGEWVRVFSPVSPPPDEAAELRRLLADAQQELIYLRAHHDECHEPAARYDLLLDRLAGVATNHGDCPIAAWLDELEAGGSEGVTA